MKKSVLLTVLLLVFLAVLFGIGMWLGPRESMPPSQVLVHVDCDVNQGPCKVILPNGGYLVMTIAPHPIPVLKPLSIEVELDGYEAQAMQIDFSGVDMDMGFNRVKLLPSAPGRFSGQASLPVCITGAMRWRASLVMEGQGGILTLPFVFDAGT